MTRALVIDDDVASAELLRVILDDAGLDVTVAADEHEIPTAMFDIIVTDLLTVSVYTVADARDWILRIADRFPLVPILVVTAHVEARHDSAALGAKKVMLKPFDVDALARAVRELTS